MAGVRKHLGSVLGPKGNQGVPGVRGERGTPGATVLIFGRDLVPATEFSADANTLGLWHFDNALTDASGNGKTLTQTPTTTAGGFSPDRVFGSRSLSPGVYEHADADAALSSTGLPGGTMQSFTVEAWVRTTRHTSTKVLASHVGWFWLGVDNQGRMYGAIGSGAAERNLPGTTVIGAATIAEAKWHHVALVYNLATTTAALVVNGKTEATVAFSGVTGNTAGAKFCVGGFNTIRSYDFALSPGLVDEVRLSNAVRYVDRTGVYPPRPAGLPGGLVEYIGLATPTDSRPFDKWMKVAT